MKKLLQIFVCVSLILSLLTVSVYAAEPVISADINGDGATDKNDAIYLLYSVLFGDDLYPVSGFSDFNCDGPVDKNDAIYLLYHSLFGDENYPLEGPGYYNFDADDYVTESDISVDTGTFMFDVKANIYVSETMTSSAELLADTLEKVSGLSFDGNEYCEMLYPDGKIHSDFTRENLYINMGFYQGLPTNEAGSAYASSWGHIVMGPSNLIPNKEYTLIHEGSHMLMWRQTEWFYNMLLNEGFAEYSTYLSLKELAKTHPESAVYFNRADYSLFNLEVSDYSKLYEQPIEYWFENNFEYASNNNYAIGFRFMWYLDDVYGDYGKWITEFEKAYCFREIAPISDQAPTEHVTLVLKATYGEDVLDNFYPWLQASEGLFVGEYMPYADLTGAEGINLYPEFNAIGTDTAIENFGYEDLYLNIETVRSYLAYKNIDSSELVLNLSSNATVRLYYTDGSYVVRTGNSFPLDDVSYIKLVGKGSLDRLSVEGY